MISPLATSHSLPWSSWYPKSESSISLWSSWMLSSSSSTTLPTNLDESADNVHVAKQMPAQKIASCLITIQSKELSCLPKLHPLSNGYRPATKGRSEPCCG